ncbi:Phthiocerol synthesis polyketide synthase type I PpsC [Auxenochlorella protothecoides]|uniref:Phthiocerol synthesis polyketide synthase type I PpsC n=1 Tax=Auxenochlorella protothecoides TaxID=3075 RepID=A0A087SNH8_AUXPR|nr:Phthiocerol synthesis polyketide synthase type I PpsC [Auxenochlorella protothecoides]KFM27282.1 Phthiocerol synthesis polyketide synthase type I PpsC [Auxenochlorella protothecoides]
MPLSRWDVDQYVSNPPRGLEARFGAILPEADLFDPGLYGVKWSEATSMDPQQRLLLDCAAELSACRALLPSTAIAVGIGAVDYLDLTARQALTLYFASGGASSVAAGRLSYVFDLHGPSQCIDTACSSSLVALHAAAQDVRSLDSEEALAAGVSLTLTPLRTAAFAITGMLAADGRCKTLDAAGDGYVRGEGCSMLRLGSQFSAVLGRAPGNTCLLAATAVNQDGRSSALTAPSGPAQVAVVRAALGAAHLTPASLAAVELHGTGTALGDPIELGALAGLIPARAGPVLTAAKSRVGHGETAAGSTGVLHALDQMERGAYAALTHLRELNPHVQGAVGRRAFLLPRQEAPLNRREGARVAGVSAFAFQASCQGVI